jgi:hypothetical protein
MSVADPVLLVVGRMSVADPVLLVVGRMSLADPVLLIVGRMSVVHPVLLVVGSAGSPEREEPDEEHSFEKAVGVSSLDTQSLRLRTQKVANSVIHCMAILLKS